MHSRAGEAAGPSGRSPHNPGLDGEVPEPIPGRRRAAQPPPPPVGAPPPTRCRTPRSPVPDRDQLISEHLAQTAAILEEHRRELADRDQRHSELERTTSELTAELESREIASREHLDSVRSEAAEAVAAARRELERSRTEARQDLIRLRRELEAEHQRVEHEAGDERRGAST